MRAGCNLKNNTEQKKLYLISPHCYLFLLTAIMHVMFVLHVYCFDSVCIVLCFTSSELLSLITRELLNQEEMVPLEDHFPDVCYISVDDCGAFAATAEAQEEPTPEPEPEPALDADGDGAEGDSNPAKDEATENAESE